MPLSATLTQGRLRVRFDPAAFPEPEGWLLEMPDTLLGEGRLEPVHESRGARVFRSGAGAATPFFWKEFRARDGSDPWKALFRASRAARADRGARLLGEVGLEAPHSLALGEVRSWGRIARAFLVTGAVTGVEAVDALARAGTLDPAARRRVVEAVAKALARLHDAGLAHGDLRPSNVLCSGDAGRVVFLDNERTRRVRGSRDRLRNLVQLGVDQLGRPYRTDRLRFVRSYFEARRDPGAAEWTDMAHEVHEAVMARRARRISRGLDPLTGLPPGQG